jgi:hypothetical protein
MATGTGNLPNPSMAFTPFDILLAEELNDLVENIESLATGSGIGDGSIGTSDLANSAVTSAKVDFTTLYKGSGLMTTISSLTTTPQVGASITIPSGVTGVVEVIATFEYNNAGAGGALFFAQIAKGSVVDKVNYTDSPAGTYFHLITVVSQISVVPGDVINFRAGRDSGTGGQLVNRSEYTIKRV